MNTTAEAINDDIADDTATKPDEALKTFGCGLWQCSNLNEHTESAIQAFMAGYIAFYNGESHNWKKSPFIIYDYEANHPFNYLKTFADNNPASRIKTAAQAFVQKVLPKLPDNAHPTMSHEFYDIGIKRLSECRDRWNENLALQYLYGYLTAYNSANNRVYPFSWWEGLAAKFQRGCEVDPTMPLVRFAVELVTVGENRQQKPQAAAKDNQAQQPANLLDITELQAWFVGYVSFHNRPTPHKPESSPIFHPSYVAGGWQTWLNNNAFYHKDSNWRLNNIAETFIAETLSGKGNNKRGTPEDCFSLGAMKYEVLGCLSSEDRATLSQNMRAYLYGWLSASNGHHGQPVYWRWEEVDVYLDKEMKKGNRALWQSCLEFDVYIAVQFKTTTILRHPNPLTCRIPAPPMTTGYWIGTAVFLLGLVLVFFRPPVGFLLMLGAVAAHIIHISGEPNRDDYELPPLLRDYPSTGFIDVPQSPLREGRASGEYGDAGWAYWDEIKAAKLVPEKMPAPHGIWLGRCIDAYHADGWQKTNWFLAHTGENAILTIAPAGSGKNSCAIMPTLMTLRDSVFVTDMKGENWWVTRHTRRGNLGQRVVTLNPFNLWRDDLGYEPDRALTHCFNPLLYLNPKDSDFIENVDKLADALIMQTGSTSDGGHYDGKARELVACVIADVCTTMRDVDPDLVNLPYVRDIIAMNEEEFTAWAIGAERSSIPRVRNVAADYAMPNKENRGVRSTVGRQLGWLDNPKIRHFLEHSHIDFASMKKEPVTVYLMLPPDMPDTYRPLGRMIVQSFFTAMKASGIKKPDDVPVTAILDEVNVFGKMKCIEEAPAIMRGYGVRVWNVFQNVGQAMETYGKGWETMEANSDIIQIFTPNDMTTAEHYSKRIGNKTVMVKSFNASSRTGGGASNSDGQTSAPHAVPFLSPTDLMGLDKTAAIVFRQGLKYPVLTARIPYFDADEQQALFGMGANYCPLPHENGHNHPNLRQDLLESQREAAQQWVYHWKNGGTEGRYWLGEAIP